MAFAGEERGLLGSLRHVKAMNAGERALPEVFVNLECLGLAPPKVWTSRSTPFLVQRLGDVANAMHLPLQGVNLDEIGDDDTHPFLNDKIPVISLHSVTQETLGILHSKRDNIDAIHRADYYDAYRLMVSI